jgi:hypothetical protein
MLQASGYEGAIESEDLRRTLYDMGWQALLGNGNRRNGRQR